MGEGYTPHVNLWTIVGAPGSPYSRKLRAALRYRQLPHRFVLEGSAEADALPQPKVRLIPRLIVEGEARTDTTPILRFLEPQGDPARRLVPDSPALAWIDALVEDYADEWVTKMMFHYRWDKTPDASKAAALLPLHGRPQLDTASLAALAGMFRERQVGRLPLVGSTPETAPIIESSYRRLLEILDAHLSQHRFLFGARPATGDFALLGQLSQLTLFDPTSSELALAEAPRVVAWTETMDDLSGLEPGPWLDASPLPETLRALLTEIGRTYAPFLLANAGALAAEAEQVEVLIDGQLYEQAPFRYQGKCLQVLRLSYEGLEPSDRERVMALLAGTGCEGLVSA